jgi:hypothetical protein
MALSALDENGAFLVGVVLGSEDGPPLRSGAECSATARDGVTTSGEPDIIRGDRCDGKQDQGVRRQRRRVPGRC